jgi:hypothetical protein
VNTEDEELCVAKSFSLKRKTIAAIRQRAAYLGISMSTYVSTVLRRDLARGREAPFALGETTPGQKPVDKDVSPSPRGVVVPEFELD